MEGAGQRSGRVTGYPEVNVIGAGIPLFGPLPRDISLRHVATRSYNGGLVQSEYKIGAEVQKQ
jgi:hypothetical protein